MRIIVGMSGGVDSSTVAAKLISEGHEVIGVTMSLWRQDSPYPGGTRAACYGPREIADIAAARSTCERLGIEYHTFDCARQFEAQIIDYFRAEYLAGRTPNPCTRCNAALKFGLLPQMAAAAGINFDCYATGHYAQVQKNDAGRYELLRAADLAKDQSYFLYRLTQEQLARQLFPLGGFRKAEVREMARHFGLAVSEKHDSQDFYSGDTADLIGGDIKTGEIVDADTGKVLGHHTGYWKYTIGQRRGLGVASTEPLYVVDIDACNNRVRLGRAAAINHHWLTAADFNWVAIEPPARPLQCSVKVRSVQQPVPCTLFPQNHGGFQAEFPSGIAGVAPGQSAVFYEDNRLLGGGVITAAKV